MNNNNNRVRAHCIPHKWTIKRCKNPNKNKCVVCHSSLAFLFLYEKCQSCKISVHGDCKPRVNDNCGLTPKHFKELLTQMVISRGQDNWAPDIGSSRSMSDIFVNEEITVNEVEDLPLPTIANNVNPNPTPDELVVLKKDKFDRKSWNMFTIRGNTTWKDLTIPFGEIKIYQMIGRGRFGEVYEAYHFGPVAIKLLDMSHVDKEKRLEAFKKDAACFQNARHENLVFFLGYTMDRDRLGIVMELIKGCPLSSILHESDSESRSDFNDLVEYAKQICQGMSYLHTKRILHKDLRSKNIFVMEKEKKVIITDFGLFNIKRLAQPFRKHSFIVPNNWLCYLAPELLRSLNADLDSIPFSESSDVYSFGTIWYELLMNSYPFPNIPPDSLIWQVGNGMKAPLTNVNSCRESKVLLMFCWSFNSLERKSFAEILQLLENLPKKTFRRSPSFPLCKSFESIF